MKKDFELVSWAASTNIYEVNTRQYTPEGTFIAFSHHIERLHSMGVEVLWFMPITPISRLNRKGSLGSYYACSSYTSINPAFGNIDDFKEIISIAHAKGMKVMIDWVANHTGCDHEWTITHPEFYKRNEHGLFYDAHGWDDVIDLDYSNPALRAEMINCMKYWIQACDIDGFRCDMAMLTPVDFWMQARTELEPLKKLFWLAELDPLDQPDYMQVFDSAYTWRWMNGVKHCKQEGATHIYALREILRHYQQILPLNCSPAWFTSNHDENSWNGTEYEKYGEMALPLAVFSCTWRGIPLIYSGQELPNHKRLAFFDKDPIEWSAVTKLHNFYAVLLGLRKKNKAFSSSGSPDNLSEIRNSVEHHVLSFKRQNGDSVAFIMINFSQYDLANVEFETGNFENSFTELFSNEKRRFDANFQYIDLKAWGYTIWVN